MHLLATCKVRQFKATLSVLVRKDDGSASHRNVETRWPPMKTEHGMGKRAEVSQPRAHLLWRCYHEHSQPSGKRQSHLRALFYTFYAWALIILNLGFLLCCIHCIISRVRRGDLCKWACFANYEANPFHPGTAVPGTQCRMNKSDSRARALGPVV